MDQEKLSISIYKVDDFEHHVPELLDKAFKDEVKKASKKCTCIEQYSGVSEEHEASCDKPVVDNKIFHSISGVSTEAIEEVNIQKYETYQFEEDKVIVHCPLELMDKLIEQLTSNNCQYKELGEYSKTIREYQDDCRNFPNETFISIDASFEELDYQLASLFAKELKKRNINKENLTMTANTKEKNKTARVMTSIVESSKLEAAIDSAINNINSQFQALVKQEFDKVTQEVINLDTLGSDLEEGDLDTILVVNNRWTSNMTLEDKQSQVVEIIKGLGKGTLEYKMALARRLQLKKMEIAKTLKSKLAKKANATVKDELKPTEKTFKDTHKEVFQQDNYQSDETISEIGEAKATRLFNNLRAKRQKQRDRAFEVLTPATVSAVMDGCYQDFEREVKVHMATVSNLASKLRTEQTIEGKKPVGVEKHYNKVIRDVNKAIKNDGGLPKVLPKSIEDSMPEQKDKETVPVGERDN